MKVILLQDIRGKGKKGQMIEASDGYARNYLLPRKMAIEATADNINTMKMNDKAKAEQAAREKAQAQEFAEKLKDITVEIHAKAKGDKSYSTGIITTPAGGKYQAMKTVWLRWGRRPHCGKKSR